MDARAEADRARLAELVATAPMPIATRAAVTLADLVAEPRLTVCPSCEGRSMLPSFEAGHYRDCRECGGRGLWWRKWWHPFIGIHLPIPHRARR